MTDYELSEQERTERRAKFEAFEMAVCPGVGKVNVANVSYGAESASEHTYTVTVEDGETTDCTCPANEFNSYVCKHRLAVESRQSVMLAASAETVIVTDGGEVEDAESDEGDSNEDEEVCPVCTEDLACFEHFDLEDY